MVGCGAEAAGAQPSITNLGVLPGGTQSFGFDVSDDGSTIVGVSRSGSVDTVFRWRADLGLTAVTAGLSGYGARTNGDGTVVVGTLDWNRAFRWTESAAGGGGGVVQNLGVLNNMHYSQAAGVSADGLAVAGTSGLGGGGQANAFRWTAGTGMVSLGELPGAFDSYAAGISGDGLVVIGVSPTMPGVQGGDRAFRWTAATGMQNLGPPLSQARSYAGAANGDGSVITAIMVQGGTWKGMRWTSGGTGELGTPAGGYTAALDITPDGTKIVGQTRATVSGPDRAFLWTVSLGMVDLNTYLPTLGIDLTGWVLTHGRGISADGRVIVGSGTFNGLPRAWAVDADKDSDGLLDSWEEHGIPYRKTDGTTGLYVLDGADKNRKDIFVEMDGMLGQNPAQAALDDVVAAFASAPVDQHLPVGGIKLHVVRDEMNVPAQPWGPMPWTDFDLVKAAHFGTPQERQHPEWDAMKVARARAFRYCVFAQSYVIPASGQSPAIFTSGGMAELYAPGVGGNDFFVTLGKWGIRGVDRRVEAGTFMHELGHTLGLCHGGFEHQGFKPNYVSVMNYMWQVPECAYDASWRLDYSRETLDPLNRDSLEENIPFGSAHAGRSFPYSVFIAGPTGAFGCQGANLVEFQFAGFWIGFKLGHYGTPVDWNGDGQAAPAYVAGPVNHFKDHPPATDPILFGHDDWSKLQYNFRLSPNYPDGVHLSESGVELSLEVAEGLDMVTPPQPSACYANCDQSTIAPVLNVTDFTCFLQRFAAGEAYANCDQSTTPPVLNVTDFTCFLQSFAAGCP